MERRHSEFNKIKLEQANQATSLFDSSAIQGVMGPTFAYDIPEPVDRIEVIQDQLDKENLRALELYGTKYTHNERGVDHLTNEESQ